MKNKIAFLLLTSCLLSAASVPAQEPGQTEVERIVRKIDQLYRSKTSYSELEMRVVTPQWERTMKMKAWSEGMKKTFIRILAPAKDRNVATLRLDNEMWNYLPNVNKVIKLPPSMMASSWMGSDFSNDDLVKESSMVEDYTYRIVNPEGADPGLIYVEFTPKEDRPIVWARVITSVRKEDYLPVSEKYYDEKGALVRRLAFSGIKRFGGREIPAVMEMVPTGKEGHRTVITYLDIRFDEPLGEGVFTLRNLQSKE